MREISISRIHVNPLKVQGKGVLATASITLNHALVLEGIMLYRGSKGIQIKCPAHQNWPFFDFGSELFRQNLIQKIWQSYHQQVLAAQ